MFFLLGLSTCQKRFEESFLFPPLGRFVPRCKKGGAFHEMQCHPSTGHCWCVDNYGTEQLGTRTRGRPNCTVPGKKNLMTWHLSVLSLLWLALQLVPVDAFLSHLSLYSIIHYQLFLSCPSFHFI